MNRGLRNLRALGRLPKGAMNKTEAKYEADVLKPGLMSGEVLWYKFEGIKLRLADNTFLTVDFAVLRSDSVLEMVDVKGGAAIFMDDARAKMKIAADLYPFPFSVVYPVPKKDGGGWRKEFIRE